MLLFPGATEESTISETSFDAGLDSYAVRFHALSRYYEQHFYELALHRLKVCTLPPDVLRGDLCLRQSQCADLIPNCEDLEKFDMPMPSSPSSLWYQNGELIS